MAEGKLFVVDHVVFDLFIEPCNILGIGEIIVSAMEDGNGKLEVLQVILWWLTLVVLFHVHICSVIKAVELRLAALRMVELAIVLEVEGATVGWQVRQVDVIPSHIINFSDFEAFSGSVDDLT